MPLFARHGYKRKEALELPYWEFWGFVRAVRKEEGQYLLRQYNLSRLEDMEGYNRDEFLNALLLVKEPEVDDSEPWTARLKDFLMRQ